MIGYRKPCYDCGVLGKKIPWKRFTGYKQEIKGVAVLILGGLVPISAWIK